jgi:serine/threonine-protein kinase RsbW
MREPADSPPDQIVVTVPLRTQFAATLRVIAASLGADAGFSIDEIDDIRLALNEVFVLLAERYPSSRGEATFLLDAGELTVTMHTKPEGHPVELDELARNILGSVVDEFVAGAEGITLTKRATESMEGG